MLIIEHPLKHVEQSYLCGKRLGVDDDRTCGVDSEVVDLHASSSEYSANDGRAGRYVSQQAKIHLLNYLQPVFIANVRFQQILPEVVG